MDLVTISTVVSFHLKRYPEMQIQDLYKLLYQAAMGNGHLVTNETAARRFLIDELENIGDPMDEDLIEPVSPGGILVRVNLRPFRISEKDPEKLHQAAINTANQFQPSLENLRKYWQQVTLIPQCKFTETDLSDYFIRMAKRNFPIQHHSAEYRSVYYPAYRIVLKQSIIELL